MQFNSIQFNSIQFTRVRADILNIRNHFIKVERYWIRSSHIHACEIIHTQTPNVLSSSSSPISCIKKIGTLVIDTKVGSQSPARAIGGENKIRSAHARSHLCPILFHPSRAVIRDMSAAIQPLKLDSNVSHPSLAFNFFCQEALPATFQVTLRLTRQATRQATRWKLRRNYTTLPWLFVC